MTMDVVHSDLVPGLVSVVTPCHNVERFVLRFLHSLVAQTYKSLEIILINDGSTDQTGPLLREFAPQLEREGYRVCIVEQENKGLAGAIDAGIKHFTGEFLTWPDPDDWLTPNSIERRIHILRHNPDVAVLRTNVQIFNEELNQPTGFLIPPDEVPQSLPALLADLIFMRTFDAPICHMVRSSCFLIANPSRSIYVTRGASQNRQMLLPLLAAFRNLQVAEPLGFYSVRRDSRSRKPKTASDLLDRLEMLLDTTENTLLSLEKRTPNAVQVVRDFFRRRRMLPVAFRGALREETEQLINASELSRWRKEAALAFVRARCTEGFKTLDTKTGRILGRALARTFDRLVDISERDCRWPEATSGIDV